MKSGSLRIYGLRLPAPVLLRLAAWPYSLVLHSVRASHPQENNITFCFLRNYKTPISRNLFNMVGAFFRKRLKTFSVLRRKLRSITVGLSPGVANHSTG